MHIWKVTHTPNVHISHSTTPYDHKSDDVVNSRWKIDSAAIQRMGRRPWEVSTYTSSAGTRRDIPKSEIFKFFFSPIRMLRQARSRCTISNPARNSCTCVCQACKCVKERGNCYYELASFPGPTQFYKQWKIGGGGGLGTRPYWTNLTCHQYKVNQMPKRRYREPAFLPFQQQSVGQTPVGSFPPVLPVPCMDHPWGPVWNTPHLVPAKL